MAQKIDAVDGVQQTDETERKRVAYTAEGLDGAVHTATAARTEWSFEAAQEVAIADLRGRGFAAPVDPGTVDILATRPVAEIEATDDE